MVIAVVIIFKTVRTGGADLRYLIFSFLLTIASLVHANGRDAHGLFTEILQDYVHVGEVDYTAMRTDGRFQAYISFLENTNPDSIVEPEAQLAFWLNAYNTFTLKVILENYPVKSINDLHFGGLYIGTVLKKDV